MIEQVMDLRPQAPAAVQTGFDYSQIDEGIRDEVKQAARSIRQLEQGVITGILAIGKRLIEVKDMIPHGQFTAWVMGEFGMEERTAQRMMSVAKEYSDPQKRQTLSLFSPSVAYMLAAPSTPEEARAEVQQAAATQKVSVKFAEQMIAKHKPERPAIEPLRKPTLVAAPEPTTPTYTTPTPAPAAEPEPSTNDLQWGGTGIDAINRDLDAYDAEARTVYLTSPMVTVTLERTLAEKLMAVAHRKALWRDLNEQEMIAFELVLSEALGIRIPNEIPEPF